MANDLISEQRIKYEKLCASLVVQKASEHEAVSAICQLCDDNERLAVICRKRTADRDALTARVKDLEERLERATRPVCYAETDAAFKAIPWQRSPAPFNDDPLYVARLVRHVLEARAADALLLAADRPDLMTQTEPLPYDRRLVKNWAAEARAAAEGGE